MTPTGLRRILAILLFGLSAPGPGMAQVFLDQGAMVLGAVYTGDLVGNVAGGERQGVVYLHNIDLTLTLHLDTLFGWRGGRAFVYGISNQGGKPSTLIGDAQGTNNIEAPGTARLYEAWLEQRFFGDRLSVLAGLYDLNTEFDVIGTGALFINSSHGIGPDFSQSGLNGPSIFPVTSLGVRARWMVHQDLYVQAVALDGVPGDPENPRGTHIRLRDEDGLLLTSELVYMPTSEPWSSRWSPPASWLKVAVGGWAYTGTFLDVEAEADIRHRGTYGLYALAEGTLYREAEDPVQGLAGFVRAGLADARVNRFGAYIGAGIVYTGLLPALPDDQMGLAVALAYNGGPYKRSLRRAGRTVDTAEANLELTYAHTFSARLAVQLDLQYVINPDTEPSRRNSLSPAFRVQVGL